MGETEASPSPSPSPSPPPSRPSGWGLSTIIWLAVLILTINISFTVSSYRVRAKLEDNENTIILREGASCAYAQKLSVWTHLIINILSTLILLASRTISSHTEKTGARPIPKWLRVISVLSVLLLHFFYNSTVYMVLGVQEYAAVLVTQDFVGGTAEGWEANDVGYAHGADMDQRIQQLQTGIGKNTSALPSRYERMSNADCMRAYGRELLLDRWDVLLVSDATSGVGGGGNNSVLGYRVTGHSFNQVSDTYKWICEGFSGRMGSEKCDINSAIKRADEWKVWDSTHASRQENIKYCISTRLTGAQQTCNLLFNKHIMIVVVVLNAIATACVMLGFSLIIDNPLAPSPLPDSADPAPQRPRRRKQWFSAILACIACLGFSCAILAFSVRHPIPGRLILGTSHTFYQIGENGTPPNLFLGNLPQIAFSLLFIFLVPQLSSLYVFAPAVAMHWLASQSIFTVGLTHGANGGTEASGLALNTLAAACGVAVGSVLLGAIVLVRVRYRRHEE